MERVIKPDLREPELPIVYREESSVGLAILFAILGVTFSLPHLSILSPHATSGDYMFRMFMSGASLAVPITFLLLAFKALSSRTVEVSDSRVTSTVVRPVLPIAQWTESLAEYRAVVVKRPSEASREQLSVVMLHRNQRRRNVTLASTESEWEAHQLAQHYATILPASSSDESTLPKAHLPRPPSQNADGIELGETPSRFEHIFVESYEIDGEYRLRQTHNESTRIGVYSGLLATTCAVANGVYAGPILLTIACGIIAALAAASIFRGAFTYDYIRITESGIARGTCICGNDREQAFIPANEVEDVVIFEDDLEKYPAVHIVGKDAVICFGNRSSVNERQWLKEYVEENFHTTNIEQSEII